MSEELKAKARRAYEEVWSDWRPEVFDEIYAPDFIYHESEDEDRNLEEYREWTVEIHANYPGIRIDIDDMLAEGDQVAARGTLTLRPGQPGDRHVRRYCSIFRFAGGKLAELWNVSCRLE